MHSGIENVEIPDSHMACAAREVIRAAETTMLYNHSLRVFAFSWLSGRKLGVTVNAELLYICSLFHRAGVTERYRTRDSRFEVDSANAACQFMRSYGVPDETLSDAWYAIALHTTPGIAMHRKPLIALLSRGVETDMIGLHLGDFSIRQRAQVQEVFARGDRFKEKIIEALGAGMLNRPATTFGTINADIVDRLDPNYRRTNFCGLVLGSSWPD
jgi:hypothetical protein